jgi:hypothetical protein
MDLVVDPNDHRRVYVAWGEQPMGSTSQTIHVRASRNAGRNWSSSDLITIENAVNPALAINSFGRVGLLYQRVVGTFGNQRWEARLSLTQDRAHERFADPGKLLASTAVNSAPWTFDPYIGDYCHLVAHNRDFYGIFSASNYPDKTSFPAGVRYQRHVDWNTHALYANAAKTVVVASSIDPFFFHYRPDPIHFLQRELRASEREIALLVEAFERGELPLAPRTPQVVARFLRFLNSLERQEQRLREEIRHRRADYVGSLPEDDSE